MPPDEHDEPLNNLLSRGWRSKPSEAGPAAPADELDEWLGDFARHAERGASASDDDELPSAALLLGGGPTRQASRLLFVIASRTAHLQARSRQAANPFLSEDSKSADLTRELAFLEA